MKYHDTVLMLADFTFVRWTRWLLLFFLKISLVVKIPRVKSYQNLKQNSWMAKGPGRRHSQTTHAAKLHWKAAKRSRVVDTRIVPPCHRKRLPRFCGPNYSKIPQPICWLGPGFLVLSAEQDRQLTTTRIIIIITIIIVGGGNWEWHSWHSWLAATWQNQHQLLHVRPWSVDAQFQVSAASACIWLTDY